MAARNLPVGKSWAFLDHRTMKEVMADERARRRGAAPAARVARRMVASPTL
jgi:truncated hemoglobin YjbI